MAIERQQNPFDTPVPGQSLTDTPKNWAWENPPRFTNSEKAAQFVWSKLHNKETASKIIILLENQGIVIKDIRNIFDLNNALKKFFIF